MSTLKVKVMKIVKYYDGIRKEIRADEETQA